MISRWYELKPAVIALRRNGKSLKFIESNLGIPRSTLSGWCKDISLTEQQLQNLNSSMLSGLEKGRKQAAISHRQAKHDRMRAAEEAAALSLSQLEISPVISELALAMLYWGEGKKTQATVLGSSDPAMLKFFVAALRTIYNVMPSELSCELHLRMDQDSAKERLFWSAQLQIPEENFKKCYADQRAKGKTYPDYHGVCLVRAPSIAIQRKLMYLYNLFCEKVAAMDVGA